VVRTQIVTLTDADAVGRYLAQRIADQMQQRWEAGTRYILGCPGGRSLLPTYRHLPDVLNARGLTSGQILIVMMDDYLVGSSDALQRISYDSFASCERFGDRVIAEPLQALGLDVEVWIPEPDNPGAFDAQIDSQGPIDTFLLASGASDGHVAFNPPGTAYSAQTRVTQLAQTTREDNLHTFPEFKDIGNVPHYGVTVGPRTIAESSRELVLVVTGRDKQTAFTRLAAATDYEPSWPATIVHKGKNALIIADALANPEGD